MSMWIKPLLGALALTATLAQAQTQPQPWREIGRPATPAEVAAWDIDVRPDFKGLPKGSGSVAKGQEVWESKCASCHGVFGESNEVFTPIVGGTTAKDIETGRVRNLLPGAGYPQRTTMMKVATVSTLWDYINRAMPWNAPKSLTVEEVYASTAYILNLADVVPADFVLSDQNIAEVQKRMPNRNGMTDKHGMWRASQQPDVKNTACMKDCPTAVKVTSTLPDYARDAHGNIQEQNRVVGPVRGADTLKPLPAALPTRAVVAAAAPAAKPAAAADGGDVKGLLASNSCTACHGVNNRIVGPGFNEVVAKHKGRADLEAYLRGKIRGGSSGVFGAVPMPPQPQLSEADAQRIARWIAGGAR